MHTARVRTLQDQYYEYVDMMKKILRKKKLYELNELLEDNQEEMEEGAEAGTNEDDIEIDSFMVINRAPAYLKESTLNYLKEQQLESLLDTMNLYEWQNYTDQVLVNAQRVSTLQQQKKKKRRILRRRTQSPWNRIKRNSETGIIFSWPIERSKFWLSSFFGPRKKPNGSWGFHYGIDMAAQRGTSVCAACGGVIEQAGYVSGYGNTVVVVHDRLYKTRYAHLDTIFVRKKQRVAKGARLGVVGDTGFTRKAGRDASHLHFELYERGKQINPLYLLPSRK